LQDEKKEHQQHKQHQKIERYTYQRYGGAFPSLRPLKYLQHGGRSEGEPLKMLIALYRSTSALLIALHD
jgi:hypothetical protein